MTDKKYIEQIDTKNLPKLTPDQAKTLEWPDGSFHLLEFLYVKHQGKWVHIVTGEELK